MNPNDKVDYGEGKFNPIGRELSPEELEIVISQNEAVIKSLNDAADKKLAEARELAIETSKLSMRLNDDEEWLVEVPEGAYVLPQTNAVNQKVTEFRAKRILWSRRSTDYINENGARITVYNQEFTRKVVKRARESKS